MLPVLFAALNEFVNQSVSDLNSISGTKQGETVVSDLQGSKYAYNICEVTYLLASNTYTVPGSAGGSNISYYQKGGRHTDMDKNPSAVVLGHELFHAWAYEFTNMTKGDNYRQRLEQETGAVEFENYLRASFGETIMRTHYTMGANQAGSNRESVASSSVKKALKYQLPDPNYIIIQRIQLPTLQRDADNTVNRTMVPQFNIYDSRKQRQ